MSQCAREHFSLLERVDPPDEIEPHARLPLHRPLRLHKQIIACVTHAKSIERASRVTHWAGKTTIQSCSEKEEIWLRREKRKSDLAEIPQPSERLLPRGRRRRHREPRGDHLREARVAVEQERRGARAHELVDHRLERARRHVLQGRRRVSVVSLNGANHLGGRGARG